MKNTVLAISLLSTALFSCEKLETQNGNALCTESAQLIASCLGEEAVVDDECNLEEAAFLVTLTCDEIINGPAVDPNADGSVAGPGNPESDKGEKCNWNFGCKGYNQGKTCRPAGDGFERCLPKAKLGGLCYTSDHSGFVSGQADDCATPGAICERVAGMREHYPKMNFKIEKEGICRLPISSL